MRPNIILVSFTVLILSSCMTSSVMLDVQRPADITLSPHIQDVVIVDRSRPSKDNLAGNIIEGLISGEGIGYDRKGAEYCIQGLSDILSESNRYKLRNFGSSMNIPGTGTATLDKPIDWDEVVSICGSYDSDAILVLEAFDSDSRTIVGDPVQRIKKVRGVKVKEIRYPASLIMEIRSGWRIYDVHNKIIVDENIFTEVKEYKSYGFSPDDAIRNLPAKNSAIRSSGIFAGRQYGLRISPAWVKIRRNYFIGKHDDLKLAKSYVKNGDWNAAIEIWKDLTESPDKKIAGRASYNMAVFSELKGVLDVAIEWANKSRELGEKKAAKYINVLHIRRMNEKKLKQQLNN